MRKNDVVDLVRCRRFEIVDSRYQVRAFIDTIEREAVFCLTDRQGQRAVEIKAGADSGAQIALLKDGLTSRLGLALTKNGNVAITLLDANAKERFVIEVDEHGSVTWTK